MKLYDSKESVLAVVGGGRWGRVIVSVLSQMEIPFDAIIVVSKVSSENIIQYIKKQQSEARLPIKIVSTLDELLMHYSVKGAIVANAANQHFETASILIDYGINVLIEKPLVLSLDHAHILLKKAVKNGVTIVPGLQYRFCSYIQNFAEALQRLETIPRSFIIDWSDQIGEVRYGELKAYDRTINVAQDVMPHVWSILSTIFCETDISIISSKTARDGQYASFTVKMKDGLLGDVNLERDAEQRRRRICVQYDSGACLSMDFTSEPGIVFWNNQIIFTNPDWPNETKPLKCQLQYFISTIKNGMKDSDIQACLESVSFSTRASSMIGGPPPSTPKPDSSKQKIT